MAWAAKFGSINSTTSFVAAPHDKCSSSFSSTTHTTLFPLCAKHFKSAPALWNHINSVHISRQEFPVVSYFSLHNCLICFSLACHWTYHKHFVQSCFRRLFNWGHLTVVPSVVVVATLLDCHRKIIQVEKVQPDWFWIKNGLARPFLIKLKWSGWTSFEN